MCTLKKHINQQLPFRSPHNAEKHCHYWCVHKHTGPGQLVQPTSDMATAADPHLAPGTLALALSSACGGPPGLGFPKKPLALRLAVLVSGEPNRWEVRSLTLQRPRSARGRRTPFSNLLLPGVNFRSIVLFTPVLFSGFIYFCERNPLCLTHCVFRCLLQTLAALPSPRGGRRRRVKKNWESR